MKNSTDYLVLHACELLTSMYATFEENDDLLFSLCTFLMILWWNSNKYEVTESAF
jgi:hypothetical protein